MWGIFPCIQLPLADKVPIDQMNLPASPPSPATRPTTRSRQFFGVAAIAILVITAATVAMIAPARSADNDVAGWVLDTNGSVVPFGGAPDLGDSSGAGVAVSIVANAANTGYWVLWDDGKVTAHGTAVNYGDLLGFSLDRPAISISVLPSETGYVVLAADGGVFTFGNALFHGSVPGVSPDAARLTTAVAIQLTSAGYRIIHDDGGVFTFGNALFHGSVPGVLPPGTVLDQPVIDAVTDPTGQFYSMVAKDGGVFSFGFMFSGSLGGTGRTDIIGAADDRNGGYALIDETTNIHWFGTTATTTITVPGITNPADLAIASTSHLGAAGSTCRLVRNEGFQVSVLLDHSIFGLQAPAAAFADGAFVGVGAWTAVVTTDGTTISATVTNRSLHRCPTRPTVIGDLVGTLTDGSTYRIEISSR